MNNVEILDLHKNDLPGFEVVGVGEVGVPLYKFNIQFLYNEKKSLSILHEFVLDLYDKGISKENISNLLAIEVDVIANSVAYLCQMDYINAYNKTLTLKGKDYLKDKQIDSLEKGDMDVLIDSLTGYIETNVNSHMSNKEAKENYINCIRNYLPEPNEETVDFSQVKKAFALYKEKNELINVGDIIEIIKLKKISTKYRKTAILIFQNDKKSVRIFAFDRNNKLGQYEEILKQLDNRGTPLLRGDIKDFVEAPYVKTINSQLNYHLNDNNLCAFKTYDEFIDEKSTCCIIAPLIEVCDSPVQLLRQIDNKIKKNMKIIFIISGKAFKNLAEESFVNKLLSLEEKNSNLVVKQIPEFVPAMVLSNDEGKILKLVENEINLCITKKGVCQELFDIKSDEINIIKNIIPEIFNDHKKEVYFPEIDNAWIRTKIFNIKKLINDLDSMMTNELGVGIFLNHGLPGENEFDNMPLATTKDRYNLFMDTINKSIIEPIKENGRQLGDKNFFWNGFKTKYPETFAILDKVRVYRNKGSHYKLDDKNVELYYKYLEEDLDGYMVEFIEKGYQYMQYKIISGLEIALSWETLQYERAGISVMSDLQK